MFTYILISLED